jgi:hypothetical protein
MIWASLMFVNHNSNGPWVVGTPMKETKTEKKKKDLRHHRKTRRKFRPEASRVSSQKPVFNDIRY